MQGLLNSKDLSYIGENYFSLTKPQEVHVNINFGNNVMFEDIMEADEIQLLGVIQDGHRWEECPGYLLKETEHARTWYCYFDVVEKKLIYGYEFMTVCSVAEYILSYFI